MIKKKECIYTDENGRTPVSISIILQSPSEEGDWIMQSHHKRVKSQTFHADDCNLPSQISPTVKQRNQPRSIDHFKHMPLKASHLHIVLIHWNSGCLMESVAWTRYAKLQVRWRGIIAAVAGRYQQVKINITWRLVRTRLLVGNFGLLHWQYLVHSFIIMGHRWLLSFTSML
jgi:hypothetical protein